MGKGRVMYDFKAQTYVELDLRKDDIVNIRKQVDKNWFDGYLGNKRGIFPISYVEVLEDEENDNPPGVSSESVEHQENNSTHPSNNTSGKTNEYFRVMYSFQPTNPDELQLTKDDVILVVEQCSDGWFAGKSTNSGKFGLFPGNYVSKVQ